MKEFELKKDFQKSLKDLPAIFIYHSENDADVPVESLQFYKRAFANAAVRILPGKDHTFAHGLPELVADIKNL